MKRIGTLAATAVLGATLLVGCGGGSSADAYCDSLDEAQDTFSALNDADAAAIEDFKNAAEDLEGDAPDDVKDDWAVINKSYDGLEDGLDEAGLTFEDLEKMSSGEVPDGVDEAALTKLAASMEDFGGEDMEKAGKAISKHAQDECDIDLDA